MVVEVQGRSIRTSDELPARLRFAQSLATTHVSHRCQERSPSLSFVRSPYKSVESGLPVIHPPALLDCNYCSTTMKTPAPPLFEMFHQERRRTLTSCNKPSSK